MTKFSIKDENESNLEKAKKLLSETHKCYVLITCSHPSKDGKMNVEMTYEGDEVLASYLVDGAQKTFDQRVEESRDSI